MKVIIKPLLSLSFLLFSYSAKAALYLEPYVGGLLGVYHEDGNQTTPSVLTINNNGGFTGGIFGGRLGVEFIGLSTGLDFGAGSATGKPTDTTNYKKTDYSMTDLGAFVQIRFPILFRIWASYIMSAKADAKNSNGTSSLSGDGYKVGIGFTGIPFVSVNFEAYSTKYDKIDPPSGTTITGYSNNISAFMFGISIPLSF
jgi:hypothetical protein